MYYDILVCFTLIHANLSLYVREMKVDKYDLFLSTKQNETKNLNMHTQYIVDNNKIDNLIYQNVVKTFIQKYIKCTDFDKSAFIYINYYLPIDYDPNDILKLYNKIEETHNKVHNDNYYNFYKNLFIESAMFSLNTIKSMYELHQKVNKNNTKCREALSDDPVLFRNYVISINWLISLFDFDYEVCLLYDFDHIHTYYNDYNKSMEFMCEYSFQNSPKYKTKVKQITKYVNAYYELNNNPSIQNIIASEDIKKIKAWVMNNDHIELKEKYQMIMISTIKSICFLRSMQTRITYLSKPCYVINKVKNKQKYDLTEDEKKVIKNLQLDSYVKDVYCMNFSSLSMHTVTTIKDGISLIAAFEKEICQLIKFTEHIDQLLFLQVKQSLKEHIKKNNKFTISSKIFYIFKINGHENNIQYDTGMNITNIRADLEKTKQYNGIYKQIICSFSHIVCNIKQNDVWNSITQIIEEELKQYNVQQLHGKLITLLIGVMDIKQRLDKKIVENNHTLNNQPNIIQMAKLIPENEKITTSFDQCVIQPNNMNSYKENIFIIVNEIMQTKHMIIEAEALINKILKEIMQKIN